MTSKRAPNWLAPLAKDYWRDNFSALHSAGLITPLTESTFAVLCQTYSDYRTCEDHRKKPLLELYVKLACQFRMTPKTAPVQQEQEDELLDIFCDSTESKDIR